MSRPCDYAVVRLHDGSYRLDRTAQPVPGQVAYAKPICDRLGRNLGWKLHPIVMVQGSRSRIWNTAADVFAATKLMTVAEARRLVTVADAPAPAELRSAP